MLFHLDKSAVGAIMHMNKVIQAFVWVTALSRMLLPWMSP
jgi:hypothetical protein